MWGFLIGLYVALIIYPYLQEWRQRRARQDKPSENAKTPRCRPSMGCEEGSMDRQVAERSRTLG